MIAVSFIFVKSWYSKASVNVHERTKILKNCVKPKTTLTKACIIILNIRVQKLCYTKVSSKVRWPTKKPCYLENHTNWDRVNWGLACILEIFQFKSWNRQKTIIKMRKSIWQKLWIKMLTSMISYLWRIIMLFQITNNP